MVTDQIDSLSAICTQGEFQRALCENRDRYILQSINTKAGALGTLPLIQTTEHYSAVEPIIASPYKRALWWARSLF